MARIWEKTGTESIAQEDIGTEGSNRRKSLAYCGENFAHWLWQMSVRSTTSITCYMGLGKGSIGPEALCRITWISNDSHNTVTLCVQTSLFADMFTDTPL